MSDLLVGKLLTIRPALAIKIGLNEAIVLQQLDYWLNHAEKEHDGKMWIYKSYEKWQEQDFPFWSVSTVKRTIKNLRAMLLIDVESLSDNFNNRVNYYTINRDELTKLSLPLGQSDTPPLGQSDTPPSYQSDTFSNESNKEIKKESKPALITDDVISVRNKNAESILNWQAPSKETMQAQLIMAGCKLDMTDGQYQLYVEDFKAYFEQQAGDGKPLKNESLRKSKLRNWLQNIAQRQPKDKGSDAARPHVSRSDAFGSNGPRLTRQQQIEQNNIEMARAEGVEL